MPLATLDINLVARLASLEQGLDRAGHLAAKQAAQIEGSFSRLKVAAAGLGGVIAGAFSVEVMRQFFVATVDGLDALNDLKDATGASIENISALEDVALRTGSSFETVSTALVKLNGVLKDAKPGSGAAETLKAIGLSAEELKRIDPAEAMLKVAQALSGFADDGNKARIVQELFGKSVQEVAPLLKDLAEQGKLNATVSTEQAEEAEKFNKQLAALKKNTVDLGRGVASDLLPTLNTLLDEFVKGEEGAKDYSAAINLFRIPLETVAILGANVGFIFKSVGREIAAIAAQGAALARGDFAGIGAISEAVKEDGETARKALDDFEARVLRIGKYDPSVVGLAGTGDFSRLDRVGSKPTVNVPGKPDKPGGSNGGGRTAKESLIAGLPLDRLEAFRQSELAATAKVNEALATEQLAEAEKNRANALALEAEQINATSEAQQRLNDRLQALIDATPGAKLEETRSEMLLLADAFEKGSITAEQFTEAAQARLGTLPEKFEKAADEMTAFSEEAARNIQDALGDTVLATLEGDFDSIEDSWKRMLNRLVSEAIAADIGKALFGNGKPSLEGAAGQIGKLFGGASSLFDGVAGAIGTYFGAENPSSAYAVNGSDFGFSLSDIPSYDVGTPYVPQDTLALVHRGERITPAAQNRPGAVGPGGTVIHNSPQIYIDGRMDQASTAQLISQALQANNRALEERMNAQGRR